MDVVFNRVIDVSNAINFPVKIFSICIILRYSPANMDALPYFLANIMVWNLMGNVLAVFLHVRPVYPSSCYALNGPITLFTRNEQAAHVVFLAIFVCILNCAIGLTLAFSYRYVVFVYPYLIKRIARKGIFLVATIHISIWGIFVPPHYLYVMSYDEYPEKDDLPPRENTYCFWPYGWRKYANVASFFTLIFAMTFVAVASSVLLWRHLAKMKNLMSRQTIELHRRTLMYLMVTTTVPLVFGGAPTLICVFICLIPELPYANEIIMASIAVMMNHGTLYAIVVIVTFKPYRKAARKLLRQLFCKSRNSVGTLF
ncbi:hypothetical protein QR680_015651 [Steinernema hermaphroditum]|uniref:Uncharacterized protein n=1 Tax=Steinernema hermaphroditum TaxID=289476 RepID=A0AA39LKM3_9BILA|nr:hypothetical protein QR680_015651 [Steinernema hermaphroditum]